MTRFRLGHIVVEPDRNRIVNGKRVTRVTAREMSVLLYLISNETRLVSRAELLDGVWGNVVVNDEALTIVISRLRSVLADNPRRPRLIETIPKKGYRLMVAPEPASVDVKPAARGGVAWPWVTVLATLLVLMSLLFAVVRGEYGRTDATHNGPGETSASRP